MRSLAFDHEFVPGKSERTLLLLHGTGGNEHDLIELGRALDPDAALISPRGKVLENGMPRFFRRLAEGVFDLEDLKLRTDELADFIIGASRKYTLTQEKMVAVGYSNGANIAASTLLLRPKRPARRCPFSRDGSDNSRPASRITECSRIDLRWKSGPNHSECGSGTARAVASQLWRNRKP